MARTTVNLDDKHQERLKGDAERNRRDFSAELNAALDELFDVRDYAAKPRKSLIDDLRETARKQGKL